MSVTTYSVKILLGGFPLQPTGNELQELFNKMKKAAEEAGFVQLVEVVGTFEGKRIYQFGKSSLFGGTEIKEELTNDDAYWSAQAEARKKAQENK